MGDVRPLRVVKQLALIEKAWHATSQHTGSLVIIFNHDFLADVIDGKNIVFVISGKSPTAQDWKVVHDYVLPHKDSLNGWTNLILTDGGGPSAAHRQELNKIFSDLEFDSMRTAVVSDSSIMRFVVSALTLLNRKIQSFSASHFEQALDFLDLPLNERLSIINWLNQKAAETKPDQFSTLRQVTRISNTETKVAS